MVQPTRPGTILTADGRPIELVLAPGSGRDLAVVLRPGEVITARVVEQLLNGSYLFTVRGRTLVAESRVPLQPDSAVRFLVLAVSPELRLRPVEAPGTDRIATSTPAARLASLGLPTTPVATLTLAAFEEVAAPLDPKVLAATIGRLACLPPAARPLAAAAAALLARQGLEATPALLRLAEAAVRTPLPDLAGALRDLRQAVASPPPAGALFPTPSAQTQPTSSLSPAPPSAAAGFPDPSARGLRLPAGLPQLAGMPALPPGEDPGTDGPPAVHRALQRAGVHPTAADSADRPASSDPPPGGHKTAKSIPVWQELVVLAARLAQSPSSGAEPTTLPETIREVLGATILPPAQMDDYDLILPLPLMDRQQTVPARVAVAHRQAAGGGLAATFVRVDAALSALGPVSIRLSALTQGPINIALFASVAGQAALADELAVLTDDLHRQGLEAHIRIASLTEGDHA